MKIIAIFLIGLFLPTSCNEIMLTENESFRSESFSINEAKIFFETEYIQRVATRSSDDGKIFLTSGEFTPLWSDASYFSDSANESYYIPIIPEYRYRAIRSSFNNGRATAYIVNVEQLLVVEKRIDSDQLSYHMLLLVPDSGQSQSFVKVATKQSDVGGFSGLAILSQDEEIYDVVEYSNAAAITNTTNIEDKLQLINNVEFQYTVSTQLYSQGEDDDPIWIDESTQKTDDSNPDVPSYAPAYN